MSEDPVKYEPLVGTGPSLEYQRGFDDAMGTLEATEDGLQIRIEALRAAAMLVAAQIAAGHGPLNINGKSVFWEQGVRWTAKQFAAYLESGE